MIGIIFATQMEAEPFLKRTGAVQVEKQPFLLFSATLPGTGTKCLVAISGIGKVTAALATRMLIMEHQIDTVVNAGVCGALSDNIEAGAVFCVAQALEGDREEFGKLAEPVFCSKDLFGNLQSAKLVTRDKPLFDHDEKNKTAQMGDLVDMEGAAIARTAAMHGVSCHIIKGVTDLAGPDGRSALHQNLTSVSDRVAGILVNGLAETDQVLAVEAPRKSLTAGTPERFRKILRFTKIEHTAFSLPLLFAGAWMGAGGRLPSFSVLWLIIVAAVGARVFGMSFNRIFDRDIDARNPRTASRELPSGAMTLSTALLLAFAGLAIYLTACAGLGGWCLTLSPLPLIPLLGYSLLKRFTSLCHFGIGLCLALAPLGAFVAAAEHLHFTLAALLFSFFVFCWMSGSDIIYALLDLESDLKNGICSLPVRLGAVRAQQTAAAIHFSAVISLVLILLLTGGGTAAWIAVATGSAAFVLMYVPMIPVEVRFFPISTVAGIAGALVPML